MLVHAHPDDESLTTGGTIARYAAEGADVRVVTCTLGEEGEVIGDRWAQLAVDHADQLGGYRVGELSAALRYLGVDGPTYLGGAGHWRDSGMAGTGSLHPRAFAGANVDDAVAALVQQIDEHRPQVVITYDPFGGYGHPDHIQAHTVTTAAVERATWQVSKLYWTVIATSAMAAGSETMKELPPGCEPAPLDLVPTYSDDQISAAIDVSAYHGAKASALRAHATQVIVSEDGTALALSNLMALPIADTEHFVLVRGQRGVDSGWESDLFAGVEL
ncbi:N-acetyl-1-D-myo-inositol-2-amino-2-deoxy-alpha-D-glucopyranoside deacetylase [Mycobacterium sp. CBMA271]|uniref:N-acetyl-1-D-myo-inositol-2-amino-2-deoxy-alpha- D-glucopyranoside deacetylase n=1 Tax=unclassified Mycobacteroides TaxID=2618759 RepID=UPI0012DC3124|nr:MULTISPECIES: N-acetyl-1-D-myo-inositol-2-amino-2-deoxy-alpha-D-glucopyranoside deacetylase [unclassified Mycobacteroides]MUM16632.1 N-acetyl-1-D-myo-inositol-2-amino-2-deoxy-alpha-D-glucopyranoside deacetylase [Mycobacteroides sp. CBMA 326]MUM22059.1 N-acetyl-1-D-myo-inositol-2-amino-2-deoxy-alpha-D-glucopyranoside deacetylase [Mycobacteroides sp. CBMA 271]